MNLRAAMLVIHVVGLVGVGVGVYATVKIWSNNSELGRKAKAALTK